MRKAVPLTGKPNRAQGEDRWSNKKMKPTNFGTGLNLANAKSTPSYSSELHFLDIQQ